MDGPPFDERLLAVGTVFALVLARVGAAVATAPLLSDVAVPTQVKAAIAVSLAALVTPVALAADSAPAVTDLAGLGAAAASEVIVGLALGLGLMAVLAGVQLTGQIVGQMSGMALAESGQSVFGDAASVFGQMYYLVTSAVFVAAGGHSAMIEGLLDTFRAAPVGSGFPTEALMTGFLGLLGLGFELGVRASGPLLLALFLATVVLGLISRTLPQVNTQAIGFGMNALLTLGVMTASIGAVAYVFQAPLAQTIDLVTGAVATDAPNTPYPLPPNH